MGGSNGGGGRDCSAFKGEILAEASALEMERKGGGVFRLENLIYPPRPFFSPPFPPEGNAGLSSPAKSQFHAVAFFEETFFVPPVFFFHCGGLDMYVEANFNFIKNRVDLYCS